MSKLKVNNLDTESGTTITVTAGKTLTVPATSTLDISAATLTPPAVMPASSAANLTNVPGANITGTIPAAALGNVDTTGLQDDIALLAFKTQANGSLARYNLVDQFVDAFEDASGVDAGASTGENRNSAGKYYSGTVASTPTGGTITTHGIYSVHSFTTTGNTNFVVGASANVDALVVAGGGGGSSYGGGGGAGGFRTSATHAVTAQTYVVTVGAGGAGSPNGPSNTVGVSGGNSVFDTITSAGGGYGATGPANGAAGGSGGGSSYQSGGLLGAGNTPSTSPAQGFPGGGPGANGGAYASSGGGGAGGAGNNAASTDQADAGGIGATNDYRTGSNVTYGGGGGGGAAYGPSYGTSGAGGAGGVGGGGAGSVANSNSTNGTPGTVGLGGGGGGTGYHEPSTSFPSGGAGGDGIVVIRYATGAFDTYANMTLVSTATTAADGAPTKGDLVFTYTNGAGTAVLGTNITAEASMDNGSTWTDFGIGAGDVQGTTGGHTIVTKNNVTLTSTSGTSMRYRIKTLVQSASLQTRIHAVSLGWS